MSSLFLPLAYASFKSVYKIIIIIFTGFLLSCLGYYSHTSRKNISTLLVHCLMPSMLFTHLSFALNETTNRELVNHLWLPGYAIFHSCLGFTIAYITLKLYEKLIGRFNKDNTTAYTETNRSLYRALGLISVAFANSGAMPFGLIEALCHNVPSGTLGFSSAETCAKKGIGFVSLYLVILSPALWAFAPMMLKKEHAKRRRVSHTLANIQSITKDDSPTKEDFESGLSALMLDSSGDPPSFSYWERFKALPPPLLATFFGLFMGMTKLSRFYAPEDSILYPFITSPLEMIAGSAVPLSMINLGGAIEATWRSSGNFGPAVAPPMPKSLLSVIVISRLILVPAISISFTYFLLKFDVLPRDEPILLVVLMLESTPPLAFQIMNMIQLYCGQAEGAAAKIYLYEYGKQKELR
ncbi:hypothetical protein TrLO_g7129 [Triparma laevis f. longispina]|uniref:Uncharacterized protein n=1 Tax=Triparma laevis f. longispina TaxID=1714387 RepID=A0A9W7A043_9STRA|nr:hypothetical protein TrLO_g7129 [Triparma laevis f. longispina]